jgi:hypothetical protein
MAWAMRSTSASVSSPALPEHEPSFLACLVPELLAAALGGGAEGSDLQ